MHRYDICIDIPAGSRVDDETLREVLPEWVDAADEAEAEAMIAAALRDAGLSSLQVQDGAESLLDGLDEDTRRRLYTDADPIYSVCNGDTPVDVLIGASR